MNACQTLALDALSREQDQTYRNVRGPFPWDVQVAKSGPAKLIASLVCKDGRIFSICQSSIRVDVSNEMLNIVLEVLYNSRVVVELLHCRIKTTRVTAGDVDPTESQEIEFSAVVIVLPRSILLPWHDRNRRHT